MSVITDPRDLANGTAPGSHVHDYWGGRDVVPVLREQGDPSSSTCNGCDDGMTFETTRPDEGVIVPQGTRWINGTFVHHSDGEDLFDRLELWVKTARDVEPQRLGVLQSGVPFSIESAQDMNDPPHYVLSLWVFQVRAYGGQEIHVGGSYDWSVDAVRGLPLVAYPPHPDRWNGASELGILDVAGGTQLLYQVEGPQGGQSTSCYSGCLGVHAPADGVVVPFDAARVRVTLTISEGVPAGIGLWFHGANTWSWSQVPLTMAGPGSYEAEIPLEPGVADSPYAPQSLWEFDVWIDQPQPGVRAWTGQYVLHAVALRD